MSEQQRDCPDCGAAGQAMGGKGLFVNLICRMCWCEWKVLSAYCPACKSQMEVLPLDCVKSAHSGRAVNK